MDNVLLGLYFYVYVSYMEIFLVFSYCFPVTSHNRNIQRLQATTGSLLCLAAFTSSISSTLAPLPHPLSFLKRPEPKAPVQVVCGEETTGRLGEGGDEKAPKMLY